MLIVLCSVVLVANFFLMVGCTDSGSHASHEKSDNVELAMRPEHDSRVTPPWRTSRKESS